jgi:hypothetical protein
MFAAIIAAACAFPLGLRPAMSPGKSDAVLRRGFERLGDEVAMGVRTVAWRGAFEGIRGTFVHLSFANGRLFSVLAELPDSTPDVGRERWQMLRERAIAACGEPISGTVPAAARWRHPGLALALVLSHSTRDDTLRAPIWHMVATRLAPRSVLHDLALDEEE